MMRKTSVILLSAATGAALTLFVTQPRSVLMGSSARAATSDTYRQLNLFGDVFERVRSDYVEKPDDSKLVESAISGMLAGLDPHSSYMDAKSYRDMTVQTRGEGFRPQDLAVHGKSGDHGRLRPGGEQAPALLA